MAIKPYLVQRRMMELGRVRLGEKGSKGEPRKLTTLRFTSASKTLLDAIAAQHGGTVRPWEGAPDEGYFEVTTETAQIDIILPPVFSDTDGAPTAPYSQFFEQWSAGGCTRRCDGETELLSDKPCMCAAAVANQGEDARTCKVTTRVSFMIPDVPGLGVWRLESHGYNAAVELPGTLEVLLLAAAEHKFIPAVLRIEQRTKKVPGEGTRRFIVPVIELPGVTVRQLASGDVPLVLNAPAARNGERPALPAAPAPPTEPAFENGHTPSFGEPPALPTKDSFGKGAVNHAEEEGPRSPTPLAGGPNDQDPVSAAPSPGPTITAAQAKKLNLLVGQLRKADHDPTAWIYAECGVDPVADDDGTIHWAPLRDTLTKAQATGLVDKLEGFVAKAAAKAPA